MHPDEITKWESRHSPSRWLPTRPDAAAALVTTSIDAARRAAAAAKRTTSAAALRISGGQAVRAALTPPRT